MHEVAYECDSYYRSRVIMDREAGDYTIADIENLPDNQRAELIDGKMYMMATPTASHQDIAGFIYSLFREFIKRENGNCKSYIAPYAVYLDESKNYVEPDVSIICDKNKLDEKGCHGAPDLVVEVVSDSSVRMDYVVKLFKYRAYGVREYWIVDQKKNRIQVYDLEHDEINEYSFEDTVPVGIYQGQLCLDFKEI